MESLRDAPHVAVIGGNPAEPPQLEAAAEVGRLLAERGAVVVCGGTEGVMEAAARGAAEAGGVVLGILGTLERADANEWVTIAVATGMGELRNGLVARAADVLIAVGGGHGTLSEIGLGLKAGKRVVGLRTWGLEAPDGGDAGVERADDPAAAVELALGRA